MSVKLVYELMLDGPLGSQGSPPAEEEEPPKVCAGIFTFRPSQAPSDSKSAPAPPPTQPQEEERAWKCLHRFLLSCKAPQPFYHTPPAESYARGSISKSSELPNSARLASGNKQIQQIRPAAASWASYGVGKTRKQYIGNAGHHDPYEEVWFVVLQASVHEVSAGVVGLMMKSGGLVLMALGLQC
ncbi:hypothetical protein NDU88_007889 [Pleurodeles waltl]|uniref:Uncharacterized protein n=1 Tax=Pleurodeles waltl TaxID=8319 RepID=A0AAV7SU01_PLEWA|nr:hypothetical protein NDU88_007889 [Pleurodeles waltl]